MRYVQHCPFKTITPSNSGACPKDLDEDLLKSIVGGVEKDEHELQDDGELDMELTTHNEGMHGDTALEPSCESRNTNTSDDQVMDMLCGELELVHSSSSTVRYMRRTVVLVMSWRRLI